MQVTVSGEAGKAASPSASVAGGAHFECPASLDGHKALNWNLFDGSRQVPQQLAGDGTSLCGSTPCAGPAPVAHLAKLRHAPSKRRDETDDRSAPPAAPARRSSTRSLAPSVVIVVRPARAAEAQAPHE
jgi:hypothetical protein